MVHEDMQNLTEVELDAIVVNKDLQELKVHGNLDIALYYVGVGSRFVARKLLVVVGVTCCKK